MFFRPNALLPCLALILALASASSGKAQDTLRAAAVVNDEVISMLDLAMRTRLAILSAGLENSPEVRNRISAQVLRSLIDERLQMQEAARLEITAEDGAIDAAINRIAKRNKMAPNDFLRFLEQNGILPTVLRDRVRAGLTWNQVIGKRIRPQVNVRDDEIDDIVRRVEADGDSAEIRMSEIFLPVDNALQEPEVVAVADRLLQQLQAGADFGALARQFSQSATASVGGDLDWVRESQLAEDVVATVRQLRPGQFSRPIKTFGGVYLVWLRDRRNSSVSDPTVSLKRLLFPLPDDATARQQQKMAANARQVASQIDSCGTANQAIRQLNLPNSGDLGRMPLSQVPPELRAVLAELPIGQPSGPLRLSGGVGIMLVCDRAGGGIDREKIRTSLTRERIELRARRYLRDLRRSANVDLRT